MKIKYLVTLLIFLFCAHQNGKAQSFSAAEEAAIELRVNSFLKTIEKRDYTKLLDFIYPPIFEHTSKESMFQFFSLLQQAGIELQFNDLQVKSKTSLERLDGIHYGLIAYAFEMEVPLVNEEVKAFAPMLLPQLRQNFGDKNVIYNQSEGFIRINSENYLIGVDNPDYKKWLFILYDQSFASAIKEILPESVHVKAEQLKSR
mgnify:CR=1 FL=1